GPLRPDGAGEALGATEAGNDAEADLGEPELGVLRGVDQVTAQGELQPATEREAVDRRDGRDVRGLEEGHDPLAERGERTPLLAAVVRHLGDVRAGHEGLLSGAGEDE